ncbi:MAG: hypothetical protein Q4A69_06455 [Moraxella sp.]|nr:hypothetical protein [Moraxella sp.]
MKTKLIFTALIASLALTACQKPEEKPAEVATEAAASATEAMASATEAMASATEAMASSAEATASAAGN